MVKNPLHLIAEVESIFHTLETGVHGRRLSAETAIGDHGLACIELILDIAASCRSRQAGSGRIPGADERPARCGSPGWVDIPCVNPA